MSAPFIPRWLRGTDQGQCRPSGPVAIGSNGDAQSDIEARIEKPGFASFPETRTSSVPQVALTAYNMDSVAPAYAMTMDGLSVAHPLIQVMPDGIEHLLVDDSGEIWVGYFDEGVGSALLSPPQRHKLTQCRWGAVADGHDQLDHELTSSGQIALAVAIFIVG